MKSRTSSFAILTLGALLAAPGELFAYTARQTETISARAVIGGPTAGTMTFTIPRLLPAESVIGMDVVLPVEIANTGLAGGRPAGAPSFITTIPGSLDNPTRPGAISPPASLVYQLLDAAGMPVGGERSVPISFAPRQSDPNAITGSAIIPAEELSALRLGGRLRYYFQVQGTTIQNAGSPFEVVLTRSMSFPVHQEGSLAVIPDTNVRDGITSVSFAPGALTNAGTLHVHQEDAGSLPAGPDGASPVIAYRFELEGTQLQRDARITFNYPAHEDGQIIGSGSHARTLAPYTLKGSEWLVLGPRQWDASLHTVSVTAPHFSTFALFPTGATAPADLRPRRKILTPNGDGQNDSIDFSGIGSNDGVKIYDMKGRHVRTLSVVNQIWDGRDDDGRIVESGVYLYQYTSQGERVSGAILVAK